MQQILIVDDEIGIRELLSEILRDEGYQVRLAENASQARAQRGEARPDLVLLDIWMPDTDGITLLKEWASSGLLTMPVVMMSGHGTIDTAVEATRIGAYDFLEKPIALQKLLATVSRALRSGQIPTKPALVLATLGRASVVVDLKQRLERVATLKTPLLFAAEPGSGVEACAKFLHPQHASWVAPENLSTLAEAPLEFMQQAREGTLFLHEVGQLSRMEQKGLALICGQFEKYNTRLICATTHSLPELVAQGTFDSRLYSTIAAVTIRIPALREHREDIPDLANLFLLRSIEAKEIAQRHFSIAALNALRNFDWPGNLAQLQSVVHTLAVTGGGEEITVADVNHALSPFGPPQASVSGLPLDLPMREARDAFERVYFEHHLAKENGNISRVADSVGLERTHLYRKLKQLGVKLTRRNDD